MFRLRYFIVRPKCSLKTTLFFFCFFITHYRRQIRKQLILHCTLSFPYKNHICTSIINGTGIRSDISFLFSSLLHTNKLSISSCVVYFHSLNEYFPYIMTEIIKYICISETYSTVYIRLWYPSRRRMENKNDCFERKEKAQSDICLLLHSFTQSHLRDYTISSSSSFFHPGLFCLPKKLHLIPLLLLSSAFFCSHFPLLLALGSAISRILFHFLLFHSAILIYMLRNQAPAGTKESENENPTFCRTLHSTCTSDSFGRTLASPSRGVWALKNL